MGNLDKLSVTMQFEDALRILRSGGRIQRAHWDGMYLECPNGGKPVLVINADKPDGRSDFAFDSSSIFAEDWCEYAPRTFGEDDYAR